MRSVKRIRIFYRSLFVLAAFVGAVAFYGAMRTPGSEEARVEEWKPAEGFVLEPIADGFEFPTAVIVTDTPDGKRYVVTELRGSIKSVTADGKVEEFATVETSRPTFEFPDSKGESGLAGICLDEDSGYLFVTYAYRDSEGILRNALRRFDLGPQGVGGSPVAERDISGILSEFRSGLSHQIGGCVARQGSLFVSVGDGWDVTGSRDPDVLLGKILRLDYEGAPAEGNPIADEPESPRAAVWAYGLRNPFGIEIVNGEVFTSNNGLEVDSLLHVRPGQDYLWDGTDESVALNALYVWTHAVSPVHIDYADPSLDTFPDAWRGGFYVAISGRVDAGRVGAGVQFVPYDPVTDQVTGTPQWVVRYTGSGPQAVTGVAIDDEGLVFTAMLPGSSGETVIYRLRFDPESQQPSRVADEIDGVAVLDQFGCLGCHQIDGQGGNIGPSLDRPSLMFRLTDALFTPQYEQATLEMDLLNEAPYRDFKNARQDVLGAEGIERLRKWVKYRIMEPRFDRIDSQMPTLGIAESDAEALAEFLLGEPLPWWQEQLRQVVFLKWIFGSKENAFWFARGVAVMTVASALVLFLGARSRRRSRQMVTKKGGSGT